MVSPLKAQERRVRVVPIIGGESGDKEFHRSGVYPIVVSIQASSKCYNCGKKGHFKSECRAKAKSLTITT